MDFCRPALECFPSEETLGWFERLGLLTAAEPSGRVYPASNMAGSVLDVLRYALERPEIELRTGCVITQLRHRGGAFTARMENGETLTAERVILAAGGAAGSRVGGVMDGYQLAKQLGHHRTALLPSLVQMKTDPTYPRGLKGVKAEADVRVLRGREVLAQGRGEILFTEYGVSGPAIFDLSRAVSTGGEGLLLTLDLLPQLDMAGTLRWLRERQASLGCARSRAAADGERPHAARPDGCQARRLYKSARVLAHGGRPVAHRGGAAQLHAARDGRLRLRSGAGDGGRPAHGGV